MTFISEIRVKPAAAVLIAAVASALVEVLVVQHPALTRLTVACCLLMCGAVAAAQWPRATAITVLIMLPFIALIRRVLLEFTPWASTDPILLVGPALIAVVLFRLFSLERREIAPDRLSKFVLLMLVLSVLEAFNPRGGGVRAGATSLLFTVVPLSWFFIGREFGDRRSLRLLFVGITCGGGLIAVYGLVQSFSGLFAWDRVWVAQHGYAALNVNGVIRAFGTFSSAAEYATFLGVAIVVCFAYGLASRIYLLGLVPVLGAALFFESGRSAMITALAGVVAVFAARRGTYSRALMTLGVCVGLVGAAFIFGRASLLHSASSSGNPLVTHALGGLADPFNSQQSTLSGHLSLFQGGLRAGLDPVGHGTASTTLASQEAAPAAGQASTARSTEVDLSNVFVSYGLFGGSAYVATVLLALAAALRVAVTRRDEVSLASLGVLVATLGQWLNGGFYAVSPIVWFVVGALAARRSVE